MLIARLRASFQKLLNNRPVLLVVTVVGVLALFALAAGLNRLDLAPAQHFVSPNEENRYAFVFQQLGSISLIEQLLLASMVVVVFLLILVMLDPEARKRVLKAVVRFILLVAVVFVVLQRREPVELEVEETAPVQTEINRTEVGTEVEFTETPMPPWFNYLTSLAVVAAAAGGGWWLWKRSRRPQPNLELDEVAAIAREALAGLAAGRDWHDTIVRCYVRMAEAVRQERGLDRDQAMTASEFATRMVRAGLPAEPVRQLTRLFEQVRYGDQPGTPEEVALATDSLRAILRACGAEVT